MNRYARKWGVGRVGLLWRGDRRAGASSERADVMLGPLFEAFRKLDVPTQRGVYSDAAADEVGDELLGPDGVLVWLNPIPTPSVVWADQ